MKKYLVFFVLSLVCSVIFWGCSDKAHPGENPASVEKGEKAEESGEPAKGEEAASEMPSEEGKADPTPVPKEDDYKVCFIGNSLIQYGSQAAFLEDIALGYGQQISVDQITWGGAYLSDYLDETFISRKIVKKRLKKADIVVFQDYGGWQGNDTLKSIKGLEKWCRKEAKFYYYMYEEDSEEMQSSDYKQLKKMGLKFIPKGQLIESLDDYTYEDLHVVNDFHPNVFNGYLAALVMHGVIFEKRCTDFPKKWFFGEKEASLEYSMKQVREILRGDSQEEKWEEFQQICKKADGLIRRVSQYD